MNYKEIIKMPDFVYILLILVIILLFVLMIIAVKKEKSLTGFYKSINVCGRWYSFFTINFILSGILAFIALPIFLVLNSTGKLKEMPGLMEGDITLLLITFGLAAVICIPIGFFMFKRAYNRCPIELRKRLFKDMFFIFLGANFRLGFFFLMFLIKTWWVFNKPTEYTVDGQTVYAYPGSNDLYDANGRCVGVANSDRTKAVMN